MRVEILDKREQLDEAVYAALQPLVQDLLATTQAEWIEGFKMATLMWLGSRMMNYLGVKAVEREDLRNVTRIIKLLMDDPEVQKIVKNKDEKALRNYLDHKVPEHAKRYFDQIKAKLFKAHHEALTDPHQRTRAAPAP